MAVVNIDSLIAEKRAETLNEHRVLEDPATDIRLIRKLGGYSQSRFAAILGVSRDAVKSWELGVCKPEEFLNCHLRKVLDAILVKL